MANSTLSRFVISRQIPVPYHEFDLRPQRKPNLPVDSRPFFVLRQTLLCAVTVLEISGGDPCTTFRRLWSGGSTTMKLAANTPLDCWLLAFSSPTRLSEAS